MSPVEKAVWWVEYCIRHRGTDHIRYPGIDIPWYQYIYLDVAAAYITIIVTFILLVRFTVRWFIRRVAMMTRKIKQKIN